MKRILIVVLLASSCSTCPSVSMCKDLCAPAGVASYRGDVFDCQCQPRLMQDSAMSINATLTLNLDAGTR